MSDLHLFHAQLAGRLEPIVAAAGYELVAAEVAPAQKLLRLYIDHDGGIGCEDCAAVSRLVSDWLDAAEPSWPQDLLWLSDAYTLEVSSPGLDRPLTTAAHFVRHVGQEVSLRCQTALDDGGRRNVKGRIGDVGAHTVCIDDGERAWQIQLANIDRARLVPALPTKE